jgi:hypothetical protein
MPRSWLRRSSTSSGSGDGGTAPLASLARSPGAGQPLLDYRFAQFLDGFVRQMPGLIEQRLEQGKQGLGELAPLLFGVRCPTTTHQIVHSLAGGPLGLKEGAGQIVDAGKVLDSHYLLRADRSKAISY